MISTCHVCQLHACHSFICADRSSLNQPSCRQRPPFTGGSRELGRHVRLCGRQHHIVTATAAGDGICPDKATLAVQLVGLLPPPKITKTDDAFAADGIEFVYSHEGIELDELNELFGKVGFPRRSPAKLQLALENTTIVLWVRARKKTRWARQGQLLGFARATSDCALFGTIWDVAVNPSWQRSGIGRGCVERLTSMLLAQDIATINLYAEPNVIGLYQRLGFDKDFQNLRGMSFQQKGKIGKEIMASL